MTEATRPASEDAASTSALTQKKSIGYIGYLAGARAAATNGTALLVFPGYIRYALSEILRAGENGLT